MSSGGDRGTELQGILSSVEQELSFTRSLRIIIDYARRTTSSELGYVALAGESSQVLKVHTLTSSPKARIRIVSIPVADALANSSPLALAFTSGKPQTVMNYVSIAGHRPLKHTHVRSMLAVPLDVRNRRIGVLGVLNRADGYGEADIEALKVLAGQVGVIIEHRRLFDLASRRVEYLRAVNEVGQRIGSILKLDELLPFVVKLLQQTFGAYVVNVFTLDNADNSLILRAGAGGWEGPAPIGRRFKSGAEGLIASVAQTGKPLIVNDVKKEPRYHGPPQLKRTRALLAVPIKFGEHIIGVLDFESTSKDAFDSLDLSIAQTHADQLATAMENARLFEAAQKGQRDTELILEMTRAASSSLRLESVLRVAANGMARAVGVPHCGVYLLDEKENRLLPRGGTDYPLKREIIEAFFSTPLDVASDALLMEVIDNRRPYVIPRVPLDVPVWRDVADRLQVKSLLLIPFVAKDRVVGMAMVATFDEYRDFAQEQIGLAVGLANSVAMAIENAALYERTREMATVEERNRLAREIHDTLAQGLAGIVLQLEAAEHLMTSEPEQAIHHILRAKTLARDSLQGARRSVWDLRPRRLEQQTLVDAIRAQIDNLGADGSLQCEFLCIGRGRELPPSIESNLLRICQEALRNIRKHAQAKRVKVSLKFERAAIKLNIKDDGVGFDASQISATTGQGAGFGLISMRERASLLSGDFKVLSRQGLGTQIKVSLPIRSGPN